MDDLIKTFKDLFLSKDIKNLEEMINDNCIYCFKNKNEEKGKSEFLLHLNDLFNGSLIKIDKAYNLEIDNKNNVILFITFKTSLEINDIKINLFFSLDDSGKIEKIEEFLFYIFK